MCLHLTEKALPISENRKNATNKLKRIPLQITDCT